MKKMKLLPALFFLWSLYSVHGQTPGVINIQGVLTDFNGDILPDGGYTLTFRLYESIEGGTSIWEESQENLSVESGVFSTILGKFNPFNLLFDKVYFLSIQVGQDNEMEPRIELTSTPYALMAKNVENNAISTSKIQDNAVTVNKIAPDLLSSINNVSNDGGNINLIAGSNVQIIPDNINKSITISSTGTGQGGNINQLFEGSNITIQNPIGPNVSIGLNSNVRLGPNGSLDILNQNSSSVLALTVNNNNGGLFGLRNQDGAEVFQITTQDDRQPLLRLNNRLGNPVLDLLANEFSDGELRIRSVLNNLAVRITTNEFTGGLINVFNPLGLVGVQLTTNDENDGRLLINSAQNVRVLDLKTNTGGGGFLGLYNEEGTEAIRLTTTVSRGGLIGVKNSLGNSAVTMSTNDFGDGGVFIDSGEDIPVIELLVNENAGGLFELKNGDGTEVVRITTLSDRQPQLRLKNRLGNQVAELTANPFSDGELNLHSVLTNPTLKLTANDNAGGLIQVFNQSGNLTVRLTEEIGGYMGILNTDETEVIQLRTLPDRNALIRINNRLGNPVADLLSNEFSDGELTFYSVLTNPTLKLGANDNAGGLISLFDREGTSVVRISEDQGFGGIGIGNPIGTLLAAMYGDPARGYGSFDVYSEGTNNSLLARMTVDNNENGNLSLFNRYQFPIVTLSGNENSDGQLGIFNIDGLKLAEIYRDAISQGGKLAVFNAEANTAANLQAGPDNSGLLQLFNSNSNLSAGFLASDDGGQLFIANGGPGLSPRVNLSNETSGGQLLLYSNETNLMHSLTVNSDGQGIYQIKSKQAYPDNALDMGGDNLGNGFFNLYNSKGFNTSFWGHNQFGDGTIELRNNLGNLGGYFTAFRDGGSLVVTDGNPGTNHRGALGNGLTGGKLSIFNNETKFVNEFSVAENGEGLIRIVSKEDLQKSRIIIGGDDAGAGYEKLYNSAAAITAEIGAVSNGSGFLSTYSPVGKRQTYLSQGTNDGGAFSIMNNNEVPVGTMSYNGTSGLVWITNNDQTGGSYLAHNTRGGIVQIRNNADKIGGELITAVNLGGELNIFNANGLNTSKLSNSGSLAGMLEIGTANGDKVARVTTLEGSGYIGLDNVDKNEVLRLTANAGKGGGIGLKNSSLSDIIVLTQDNAYGSILVNNPAGGLINRITHATNGAGFIGNRDHKGGEAVWILGHENGGGQLFTFNDLGNTAIAITQDNTGQGLVSIKGSAGNEIARVTGTTGGTGLVSIDNSAGINLAGMTFHTVTGSGYLYTKNASGNEIARMSGTALGNGIVSIGNSSGTNLAGITMGSASGGGYLYANNPSGIDAARMSTLSGGQGYISIDNNAASTISYLTSNTVNGGYIGVANSVGQDRARLTTTSTGAGFISNSNAAGNEVVEISSTVNQHGTVETSNASGAIISGLLATSSGQGYMRVSNSAGNERAFMGSGDNGGTVAVRDVNGNQRVSMSGSGFMEVVDANGSYMNAGSTGAGINLLFVDNFQHPRAEIKGGYIAVKGPNGIDHSFMASATAPNLGYIGVCNSNVVNSPVEAGMYVNESSQGVLFADIKNFKMDYPGKPEKQIWYGSLEGPELAAYIRGTGQLINGKAMIEFTDHYKQVANTGTMTVILTPLNGKSRGLAVVKKSNSGFEVEELMEGTGTYDFDWEVKCVRNGYEDFEPVRDKALEPRLTSNTLDSSQILKREISELRAESAVREKIIKQQ